MFRKEKIVPNISFASSCALNLAGRALAGPRSTTAGALLSLLISEIGRPDVPPEDMGLSCLAYSLE